jgi:hypothetical protein
MRSLTARLFLVLALLWSVAGATEQVVRVDLSGISQRGVEEFLRTHPDILGWGEGWADILTTSERLQQYEAMGLEREVLIPDAREYEADLRRQDYFDYFHDYQEILDELEQIVADHPTIVELYDIGDTWEKTQGLADRDIWALKISDNVESFEREEPEVLIMANLHAREIITPEIAMYTINYLVDNYGTDPRVTELVDERQIWVIPTCNPDGLDYVHQVDMWWRKNRRDNGDGTYGVDLNRNFGYMWGYDDIGSSPNPWDETYRGAGPFSEPETQVIRDFTEAHTFVISLSYHSYGNWWLYPWGYIPANTPDHPTFVAIADSCVAYNGYEPGNSASGTIYPTNGDSDDWFYGEQTTKYKVFGFTPEVGYAFHPDTSDVEELILENLGPNLYVMEAVEEYSPVPEFVHEPLTDTEDVVGPYQVVTTITSAWPLDESTAMLHYRWEGGAFDSVALAATGQDDEYEGWLPGPGVPGVYEYYLSASDSIPRAGYAPAGAPDSVYSFGVGLDSIPPVIVHMPLGDQAVQAAPYAVWAEVTDNVGVDSVWMEYRVNGGTLETEPLLGQGGDDYLGWLDPVGLATGDSVEYRLIARDAAAAQNTTTDPAQGYYGFAVLEGYSYDFEGNDGGFTASEYGDWEWGVPTSGPNGAHSGQRVWATNLAGQYIDGSNSTLDSDTLSLVNATEATLTFWHWYRIEYSDNTYWDGGNVKISTDGGETFQVLYPEGGYDGVATNPVCPLYGEPVFGGPPSTGNFWHQESFDLSAYYNRTVIIRFHFGSDAYVTDLGWYVDDVLLLTPQSQVPLFRWTTDLPTTADTTGPYVVTSEITDDGGITAATLYHRADGGLFTQTPLQLIDGFLYQAEIPGQPYGTTVEYYLSATDNESNTGTDPAGAPESLYTFVVTERLPEIGPLPTTLQFTADPGESATDTLLISNLGLIDLQFALSDSCIGGGGPGMVEVISDPQGDVPAGIPDILTLNAEKKDSSVVFEVVFAPGWPESTLAVVSLDLDQDPSTGQYPPVFGGGSPDNDVGAELEVIFDFPNFFGSQMGLPEPSAIVLTEDQLFVGSSPLIIGPDGGTAQLDLAMLDDDGNMNVSVLSVADAGPSEYADFAPDLGHGVVGEGGDALWLTESPASGTVGGESSLPVCVVADAAFLGPGTHQAILTITTNDPVDPVVTIDVTFEVQGAPAEDPLPMPTTLTLRAGPNPFSQATTVRLGLPEAGRVTVRIYDVLGRRVRTLVDGQLEAGWHAVTWDGTSTRGEALPSGLYVCRARVPGQAMTVRIVKTR